MMGHDFCIRFNNKPYKLHNHLVIQRLNIERPLKDVPVCWIFDARIRDWVHDLVWNCWRPLIDCLTNRTIRYLIKEYLCKKVSMRYDQKITVFFKFLELHRFEFCIFSLCYVNTHHVCYIWWHFQPFWIVSLFFDRQERLVVFWCALRFFIRKNGSKKSY